MSLVSEALRKARAEAAAREGRSRGLPTAVLGGVKGPRRGAGAGLIALIAVAAAVGGAALAWWVFGRSTPSVAGARAAAAAPAAAATTATGPTPTALSTVSATRPAAEARAVADVVPPPATAVSGPRSVGATGAPAAVPTTVETGSPADGTVDRPPSPARPAEGGTRERSFVLTADLGYARLHLDFIVYKPSAPFGRVNGQDIVVGSIVDKFVVEEIGESYVRLRDGRGAVVLRVH